MFTYDEVLDACIEYFDGDELAARVTVDKYLLKNANGYIEKTPTDIFKRIAGEIIRVDKKKFSEPLSFNSVFSLLDNFKYVIPAGSVMFGCGNNSEYVSLANCYLIKCPEDNYSDIIEVDKWIANICKRRGGVGFDISNLRPAGLPVQNSAKTTSGIVPFMARYSNTINEVGIHGRRAAGLISIDVKHPQCDDFIKSKVENSNLTGVNISVKITNDFMNCVVKGKDFEQKWPILSDNPTVSKTIKARELFDLICDSAHKTGDPGVLFIDTINEFGPPDQYEGYKSVSTNPCLHSSMKVFTSRGYVKIEDLEIGEMIWSTEGWTKVVNKINQGVKDVYEYTMYNKGKLLCTMNHNIMSNGKKTEIGELKPVDELSPLSKKCGRPQVILLCKYIGKDTVYDITVDNDSHTFYCNGFNVCNCGEVPLEFGGACRLLSLNLVSYVDDKYTNKAKFNWDKFYEHCKLAQRIQDNIVDLEIEKLQKILKKVKSEGDKTEIEIWSLYLKHCKESRRTGTGFVGLADTFAALGIKYGSKESIKLTEKICQTLKHACYESSIEMAEEIGAFKIYDSKKEKSSKFIQLFAKERPDLYKRMVKSGRRNIAILSIAPTGSLSIVAQTSSGIEPVFQLTYTRKRRAIEENNNAYSEKWEDYEVLHHELRAWMDITQCEDIEKSPWHGCTAHDITPEQKIDIQAAAQKHIDGSISSTVNMKNTSTVEDIQNIYIKAWKSGLKGITVFRDGCKQGILQSNKSRKDKRPKILKCEVFHPMVNGERYYVIVGLWEDGTPYEVFAGKNGINKNIKDGIVIRKKKGFYKAEFPSHDEELSPITAGASETEEIISRLTSLALRGGVDIHRIVKQLEKVAEKNDNFYGFSRAIVRTLKKYIDDGTKEDIVCPSCGSSNVVRSDGCPKCLQCGWSKCL